MRKTGYTLFILLTTSFFLVPDLVFAQNGLFGIHEGDFLKYSVSGFCELYSWNMTSIDAQKIEYIELNVKEISEGYVYLWGNFVFKNGTISNEGLISKEDPFEDFVFVIGSNLDENEFVNLVNLASDETEVELTNIVSLNYLGLNREAYQVNWRIMDGNCEGYLIKAYWDKESGILVEMDVFDNQTEDEAIKVLSYKLENTNLWVIPEFPSWTILPMFALITLSVIGLKKYFNKKEEL